MKAFIATVLFLVVAAGLNGCGKEEGHSPPAGNMENSTSQTGDIEDTQAVYRNSVTHARALDATNDVENWLLHGRTYDEQRFSPLEQINRDNVNRLGVAWALDIPSTNGLVATPIIVDGTIYLSAPFSVIHAIDAASGELLWSYDPQVRLNLSVTGSWVSRWNRGVAVWNGKVIVGTGDCRLVAVDAEKGTPCLGC